MGVIRFAWQTYRGCHYLASLRYSDWWKKWSFVVIASNPITIMVNCQTAACIHG